LCIAMHPGKNFYEILHDPHVYQPENCSVFLLPHLFTVYSCVEE